MEGISKKVEKVFAQSCEDVFAPENIMSKHNNNFKAFVSDVKLLANPLLKIFKIPN